MIALDYNEVDNFVSRQQRLGNLMRWDGWTIVVFNADRRARNYPNGRFYQGRWGFESRISPNRKGLWLLKPTLVRGGKRARR